MAYILDWLDFALVWFLVGVGVLMVYEGTRKLALRSEMRFGTLLLLIGSFFVLWRAVMGWSGYSVVNGHYALAKDVDVREILKEDFDPEQHPDFHERSLLRARIIFREAGDLVHYYTAEGERILYTPSMQDIESRVKNHASKEMLKTHRDLMLATVVQQILLFLAALVGGLNASLVWRQNSTQ